MKVNLRFANGTVVRVNRNDLLKFRNYTGFAEENQKIQEIYVPFDVSNKFYIKQLFREEQIGPFFTNNGWKNIFVKYYFNVRWDIIIAICKVADYFNISPSTRIELPYINKIDIINFALFCKKFVKSLFSLPVIMHLFAAIERLGLFISRNDDRYESNIDTLVKFYGPDFEILYEREYLTLFSKEQRALIEAIMHQSPKLRYLAKVFLKYRITWNMLNERINAVHLKNGDLYLYGPRQIDLAKKLIGDKAATYEYGKICVKGQVLLNNPDFHTEEISTREQNIFFTDRNSAYEVICDLDFTADKEYIDLADPGKIYSTAGSRGFSNIYTKIYGSSDPRFANSIKMHEYAYKKNNINEQFPILLWNPVCNSIEDSANIISRTRIERNKIKIENFTTVLIDGKSYVMHRYVSYIENTKYAGLGIVCTTRIHDTGDLLHMILTL